MKLYHGLEGGEVSWRATRADSLYKLWQDPQFDPTVPTFYYARVLENPTCRWSWRDCLSLPASDRPAICDDPSLPRTVEERAWTSPIWVDAVKP